MYVFLLVVTDFIDTKEWEPLWAPLLEYPIYFSFPYPLVAADVIVT